MNLRPAPDQSLVAAWPAMAQSIERIGDTIPREAVEVVADARRSVSQRGAQKRRWSSDEEVEAYALYLAGKTNGHIAEALSRTLCAVNDRLPLILAERHA